MNSVTKSHLKFLLKFLEIMHIIFHQKVKVLLDFELKDCPQIRAIKPLKPLGHLASSNCVESFLYIQHLTIKLIEFQHRSLDCIRYSWHQNSMGVSQFSESKFLISRGLISQPQRK